jgi:putative methionine-R-sulfoxide reductase with GAF domain
VNGDVVAVLNVESIVVNAFTPEDVKILETRARGEGLHLELWIGRYVWA